MATKQTKKLGVGQDPVDVTSHSMYLQQNMSSRTQ